MKRLQRRKYTHIIFRNRHLLFLSEITHQFLFCLPSNQSVTSIKISFRNFQNQRRAQKKEEERRN